MLDAGRPPERIAGLTVYFDHADEQRRYVLAEVPRIVAKPDPQLSLIIFRGEQNIGGLLQLESILSPTEEQLKGVTSELAAFGRTPILSRPDWRAGCVQVAGWLETDEIAPLSLSMGSPSLLGDPTVMVAARLDANGAALADAALHGNALPTVLIFDLETLGLSGPLGIEAEADLQVMHDRLTAEGALNTPYGRARIAKTWEEFARDNLIRIRVVDESGDIEHNRAEAMRRVGEDLIARMFSPYPPPERPPQLDDESMAPIELSFRLTMRREELETTSHWSFLERRVVRIRHYAAASLVDLLGDSPPGQHIGFADLTAVSHNVAARVEPELNQLGLAAIEADVSWSGGEGIDHTLVLTDAHNEESFVVERALNEPLRYRVRARFNPEKTRAEDRESEWLEANGGLIVVSARRLFPPREFTVIGGHIEFDWLDHVEVVVTAPEELPRSLRLDSTVRTASVFFPAAGEGSLSLTTHWRGLVNEPTRSDAPRQIRDDLVILDSPFGNSIRVLLVPLPLPNVMTLVVELLVTQDDYTHEKSVTWEGLDRTPKRVGLRRLVNGPRSYSYRVTMMKADGSLDQRTWQESDTETLVIPSDEPVALHTVEVVLLGGGPAGRGSFAVELVLEAGEYRASQVLEHAQDHAELVLVTPQDDPTPTLTAREFMNSGRVHESRWENPEKLTVMVIPPSNDN